MDIAFRTIRLHKRFPLAISRGVSGDSDNLFVSVTHDGITGWGEMAPSIGQGAGSAAAGQTALTELCQHGLDGLELHDLAIIQELDHENALEVIQTHVTFLWHFYHRAREIGVPPCALAALDIALWDWSARKANTPLYQLFGLGKPRVPTSITIGINPPEVVRERIPLLLDGSGIRALKVKLGSPDGIEADQAMFAQVVESTRNYPVSLRVDANGGWSVAQARVMMKWLAARNTEYVEQPLAHGRESGLPALFKNRPLPIFVDESCQLADNLPDFAHAVDGVNLKLMKCGGITEAFRIIATAKMHKLKTMIGCMSESSLAISAAAAITGAFDHIDLDSQLNLDPDPCIGARLRDGIVMPNDLPGHGARFV